jgi:hypothetical protein
MVRYIGIRAHAFVLPRREECRLLYQPCWAGISRLDAQSPSLELHAPTHESAGRNTNRGRTLAGSKNDVHHHRACANDESSC